MRKILGLALLISGLCVQTAFCASYFELGKAAFERENYTAANTYFVHALTEEPNNATWRYYYALTLTYLGNNEQARKEYGYVIQLDPTSIAAEYSQQAIMHIDEMYASEKLPSKDETKLTNESVVEKQNEISSDNYIQKAVTSNGELVTWDLSRMPLKVYINNSYRAKQMYLDAAKAALQAWQSASAGQVQFVFVENPQNSDITLIFKGLAQKTENQILGLTQHKSLNGYIDKVSVTLYTLGPNYKMLSADDVYNVALHEFGHMLGIWGHSDNKNDVMYAMYDTTTPHGRMMLSASDKNTAKTLYVIDKNPYSTSAISINKVLGTKAERVDLKLQQGLEYIKEVPGNPIGYVNVANTYKSLGKEFEAISYYKKALQIDSKSKEANWGLASIYFERNDLKNAEIYFKNIIKIEPKNHAAYCNLMNLYIKNNKSSYANSLLSSLLYRNSQAQNEECVKQAISILKRKK